MQQRDQARAALVDEAEFPLDEGADLARRARQRGVTQTFNASSCAALTTSAAAHVEAGQALDAVLVEQLCQPRIVSSSNNSAFATS